MLERLFGEPAPDRLLIRENGLRFELSLAEGCSVGLFLDQRDNRRRLLTGHIARDFDLSAAVSGSTGTAELGNLDRLCVLNLFAYTCGFSVCAARAGARSSNVDISKKYLDWGRRNFEWNELDSTEHEFLLGDAFEWLRRLGRKNRKFDLIILDPPTFSRSREHGAFRVEKEFPDLIRAALPLLNRDGVLFASSNAATWRPEQFLQQVSESIERSRRRILQEYFAPQPPDFPVTRAEPGYLKTVWLRIE